MQFIMAAETGPASGNITNISVGITGTGGRPFDGDDRPDCPIVGDFGAAKTTSPH